MVKRAADLLVETLAAHAVDRLFCVPGESFLAVLDALADASRPIDVVTCRHEGGAGYMALADAKLTGRAGVAFVSRGPGACNASIAVHAAQQDANPLVLFVGQVERGSRHRRAFQEVDYVKTFSDMAKWVVEIDDPNRVSELVAQAFQVATGATPGPVVVSLPEDMLSERTEAPVVGPRRRSPAVPSAGDVAAVAARLAAAARPLLIAGGGTRSDAARQALLRASEAWGLPVAVTNKQQDVFANRHPHWAGHLGYAAAKPLMAVLQRSDLILAVGTRLGDVSTQGYAFPRAPVPDQALIHVHPDSAEVGRIHLASLGLAADAEPFLAALAAMPAAISPQRRAWIAEVSEAVSALSRWSPQAAPDGVDFGHVVDALAAALPSDGILTLDSGNFVSWVHRYFPFAPTQTLVGAVSGAMGLGVPAAVAAALRFPERPVVALVGDGGFLMTGNEIATAARHRARLRIIVANNASYGTIRTHQELAHPRRVMATDLTNPDFVRLAEAYGMRGLRIAAPEQARPVVAEMMAAEGPVLVVVETSLEHISANASITALRNR